ncbi:hypothetical protein CIT292_07869 [Citrobacter youngae ATCC 29220]|uniref:Uncharacterized protein n=1 Tax=Citrobacter youngae ATCC 29220 TaxID=500640 RepID=D4BBS9_9ENTR|nr:hypothetical protein CIT292_07869 [Citrobacter youngae ATCC 29220]
MKFSYASRVKNAGWRYRLSGLHVNGRPDPSGNIIRLTLW